MVQRKAQAIGGPALQRVLLWRLPNAGQRRASRLRETRCQLACKPGSVWRVAPPRRPFIWDRDCSRPLATNPGGGLDQAWSPSCPGARAAPIRSCSRWGLPCRPCYQGRGALLPHRFTLAFAGCPAPAVSFSVALSLGSPPAAVSRHRRSLEPGLSSTGRVWPQSLIARQRPSGQLAGGNKGAAGRGVKGGRLTTRSPSSPVCSELQLLLDSGLQRREGLDGVPDHRRRNLFVVMPVDVASTRYVLPGNIRVPGLQVRRQATRCPEIISRHRITA